MLLKGKEAELRAARESGAASEAHQAELAAAKAALAEVQAAADAVRAATIRSNRVMRCPWYRMAYNS